MFTIPTNCDCGSTAGCPLCMPDNYCQPVIPNPQPQQWMEPIQREGWICTKCKTSNSPDNKTCEKCESFQAVTYGLNVEFAGLPEHLQSVGIDPLFTDGNHG